MEFHPIANVFPLLEGDEFKELCKDVREQGQQQPILTYEGMILDGRNRYRACLEVGEEPWTETWSGSNPVEAVISLNLHRRHLNSSQRSAVAAGLMPHMKAEAKKRQQRHEGTAPGKHSGNKFPQAEKQEAVRASEQAAEAIGGTNRKYVERAVRLKEEEPETFEEVLGGKVGLSSFVNPKKPEPSVPKPEAESEPESEPTMGTLLEKAGVSMDDAPRRSDENKALYPTWQAILKVADPMTERIDEGIPETKQFDELKRDAEAAQNRLSALIARLDHRDKNRLRAVK